MSTSGRLDRLRMINVLKLLVHGQSLDFTAVAASVPRDLLVKHLQGYGWPRPGALEHALEQLEQQQAAASTVPQGGPDLARAVRESSAAGSAPVRVVKPAPPPQHAGLPPVVPVQPPVGRRHLDGEPCPGAGARVPDAAPPESSRAESPEPGSSASSTVPAPAGSVDAVLAAAGECGSRRARRLVDRVAGLVQQLSDELAAWRLAESARAERAAAEKARAARIAELEAELAKLRGPSARSRGPRVASPAATGAGIGSPGAGASHVCGVAGCDRVFGSVQGVVLHRRRAHPAGARVAADQGDAAAASDAPAGVSG